MLSLVWIAKSRGAECRRAACPAWARRLSQAYRCSARSRRRTFRIGLDKLGQTERAVKPLEQALGTIAQGRAQASLPAMAA